MKRLPAYVFFFRNIYVYVSIMCVTIIPYVYDVSLIPYDVYIVSMLNAYETAFSILHFQQEYYNIKCV